MLISLAHHCCTSYVLIYLNLAWSHVFCYRGQWLSAQLCATRLFTSPEFVLAALIEMSEKP